MVSKLAMSPLALVIVASNLPLIIKTPNVQSALTNNRRTKTATQTQAPAPGGSDTGRLSRTGLAALPYSPGCQDCARYNTAVLPFPAIPTLPTKPGVHMQMSQMERDLVHRMPEGCLDSPSPLVKSPR